MNIRIYITCITSITYNTCMNICIIYMYKFLQKMINDRREEEILIVGKKFHIIS